MPLLLALLTLLNLGPHDAHVLAVDLRARLAPGPGRHRRTAAGAHRRPGRPRGPLSLGART